MTSPALGQPSYRALFRVAGMPRLALGSLGARTAASMLAVALVLLLLARFHSPTVAGVGTFLSIAPGLLVSPVAGALLDRRGRIRLIRLDYAVAAAAYGALAGLSAAGLIGVGPTLLIVAVASLTNPLSSTGTRSLVPLVVPRHLWDRANAADSTGYVLATLIGPAVAGVVAGTVGPEAAVATAGGLFAAAAAVLRHIPEPAGPEATGPLLRQAVDGARYVAADPTLRGLAAVLSVFNLSYGAVIVAMPVLVLRNLGSRPSAVGLVLSFMGVAGVVSGVLTGRVPSEGRERRFLVVGTVAYLPALAVLAFAPSLAVVAVGMAVMGAANGPIDIGLFGMRQRRTDPARLGTAFAVSMALNYAGVPLGSALAGPIASHSARLAIACGVVAAAVSTVLAVVFLPGPDEPVPAGAGVVPAGTGAGHSTD